MNRTLVSCTALFCVSSNVLLAASLCATLSATFAATPTALALSRDAVMTRAKAFAYHPWRAAAANQTASCNSAYRSVNAPGDYMGLPYDWGGYMTLAEFDQQLAGGAGAGSYPNDGVLSCTAGLDCSGFVSKAWGVGHFTTRNLATISTAVSTSNLLPGDIFNEAGYHVAMFSHRAGNGEPIFYESINYNVHINVSGGWSWVDGWAPLRHTGITGTAVTNPLGTLVNPIAINSFPFTDTRDTRQSPSSVLDRCGAATDRNESGPEYVYRANFTQPGQLTVSVSDDVGVDIDVHLYRSSNMTDCVARHDTTFTRAVGCGEHLIVADTFGSATNAGAYNLTVTFTPSGQSCGTTTPLYNFFGAPGQACEFPGNTTLPTCNPNLGAEVCLYNTRSSWCTRPCAGNVDCGDFAGGCCAEIAAGERYCMPSTQCGGSAPDGGTVRRDGGIMGGDPDLDAGVVADAGTTVDAGTMRDAGTTRDAGTAPDAGTEPDAGITLDAGAPRDAGTPRDAGASRDAGTPRDAGTRGTDAGTDEPARSSTGGCSVTGASATTSVPWLVFLALGALTAHTRRRRRRT